MQIKQQERDLSVECHKFGRRSLHAGFSGRALTGNPGRQQPQTIAGRAWNRRGGDVCAAPVCNGYKGGLVILIEVRVRRKKFIQNRIGDDRPDVLSVADSEMNSMSGHVSQPAPAEARRPTTCTAITLTSVIEGKIIAYPISGRSVGAILVE